MFAHGGQRLMYERMVAAVSGQAGARAAPPQLIPALVRRIQFIMTGILRRGNLVANQVSLMRRSCVILFWAPWTLGCHPDHTGKQEPEADPNAELCPGGLYGEAPTDDATIFVYGAAQEQGQGTEDTPYASIGEALDAWRGGGASMIAVAPGEYGEALVLGDEDDGLIIAGACAAAVQIRGDGSDRLVSLSGTTMPGVTVSGMTLSGSPDIGVEVAGGSLALLDGIVADNAATGIEVGEDGIVDVTTSEIRGNGGPGVHLTDSATFNDVGSVVHDNTGEGVWLETDSKEAILHLTGTEIGAQSAVSREEDSNGDDVVYGVGILLDGGADVTLDGGVHVHDCSIGILDDGGSGSSNKKTSRIVVDDVTVDAGALDGAVSWGVGIYGRYATLTGGSLAISGHQEALVVSGHGLSVVLDSLTIDGDGYLGDALQEGIHGWGDVTVELTDAEINNIAGMGIYAWVGPDISMEGGFISDTHEQASVSDTGVGIAVCDGASVSLHGVRVTDTLGVALLAFGTQCDHDVPSSTGEPGTISLDEGAFVSNVHVEADGGGGIGLGAYDGGEIEMDGGELSGVEGTAALAAGTDVDGSYASFHLDGVLIDLPGFLAEGDINSGLLTFNGAYGAALDTTITGARGIAAWSAMEDSRLTLYSVTISALLAQSNGAGAAVAAYDGGTVNGHDLVISDIEGAGLYALNGDLNCETCQISFVQFAGAVGKDGGMIDLYSGSSISDVDGSGPLGGGIGVYMGSYLAPAMLLMNETTITPSAIAGVYIVGDGLYELFGNTIAAPPPSSGSGGSALIAAGGVPGWDGVSGLDGDGLLLRENTFSGSETVAVLLDASSAYLAGNVWQDNVLDLSWQGCSDTTAPPTGYEEVPLWEECPDDAHYHPFTPSDQLTFELAIDEGALHE